MIKVLIADDHVMVREGLKRFLAEANDINVDDEASDGQEYKIFSIRAFTQQLVTLP